MPHADAVPEGARGVPDVDRNAVLPLAYGDLDARDALELVQLKAQIRRATGFLCEGYKEKCLRRRIAVRMRARGVHRYADYAALIDSDADERERLIATVTINVSRFFRNPEVWEAVRTRIVPSLFELDVPRVRIWSAGAAGGEEAYTLAILLREHAEATGQLRSLRRFDLLGTDIDRDAVEHARRAEYAALAVADTPAPVLGRWFQARDARFRLEPEIRDMVRFETGDLLTGPAPQSLHLVFCRNVIIYFERAVQEDLFGRFAGAIVPGGHLVLGKVETLFGAAAPSFRTVCNPERIFGRV